VCLLGSVRRKQSPKPTLYIRTRVDALIAISSDP
jgi:hypothetical protein